MSGKEVFKVAVNKLGAVVEETLAANGLERSAIDWLVPHQANIRIIQATAAKLDMPMERVIVTVQDHGNTSAASVPLALDVGVRDGRIKRGELLLLEAFGGGFTWGSALCATERPCGSRKRKTPRNARRFVVDVETVDYFETERLNIRSIFSLVASQHDWLA